MFPAALLAVIIFPIQATEPTSKTVSSVEIVGGQVAIALQTKAGETLDPAKLSADVKSLWRSGRFSDIRAETEEDGGAVRVVFRVRNEKTLRLRKVEVKPPTPGIELQLKPDSEITALEAHEVGVGVRKRLESVGYPFAKVDAKLLPVGSGRADLQVLIDQGRRVEVAGVTLTGHLGAPGEDARKALKWTGGTTIVPPIPGIWNGWRLQSNYTESGVEYDLSNLQSFYYTRGYFDASVKADPVDISAAKTSLSYNIQAGPRYAIRSLNLFSVDGFRQISPGPTDGFPARDVCNSLIHERRKAERDGVLDFTAKIEVHDVPDADLFGGSQGRRWADLTLTTQRGQSYRIGHIDFRGNRSFSDKTVRRAFVLDEGDLLDEERLRKSLTRINNTGLFQPLSERNVAVNTPPGSDLADILVDLHERKIRRWNLAGPVGPLSIGGPLTLKIGTRLPPWGWRLIELSTYSVSMNFMLYPKAVALLIPGFPHSGFLAAATISRPLLPGEPFLSGFTIAPQLGWEGVLEGYGISKARWLLGALFKSGAPAQPALPVSIVHVAQEGQEEDPVGVLYCEAPKPRLNVVRQVGDLATGVLFSFAPF
jgi:outer membrane protein assembly factor BamA